MFGIAEWIAGVWCPAGLIEGEWARFLENTIYFLIITVILVYLLYRFYFPKIGAWKINDFNDVFKLRRPFIYSLLIITVIEVIGDLIIGFVTISEGKPSAISYFVSWSLFAAIIGILAYWILALIFPPPKLKYTPWGSYFVHSRLSYKA